MLLASEWKTVRSSGDADIDASVWDKTMEEVGDGLLTGPIAEESLSSGAVVSRRFGIRQGGKIRPIDDYTQSMVNNAVMV